LPFGDLLDLVEEHGLVSEMLVDEREKGREVFGGKAEETGVLERAVASRTVRAPHELSLQRALAGASNAREDRGTSGTHGEIRRELTDYLGRRRRRE
jgi:hypothetical protein